MAQHWPQICQVAGEVDSGDCEGADAREVAYAAILGGDILKIDVDLEHDRKMIEA
jgi:hypothetical protein